MKQKILKPGGFVAAGLPSIRQHLKTILKNQPDYFTHEGLNNFLLHNCNKVLSSVGTALKKEKLDDITIFRRYQRIFDRFKETGFLNNCELMIDSAGFQYQCGLIPRHFVETFVNMYHDFLERNVGRYSYAFLFDPVPGATQSVVKSYDEMEKLNVMSYEKASKLSPEVKKSILYIHHFRTPKINKLYKKLLFDYKFADHFENFSTGGLISFLGGSQGNPPCNMYVIPLISILKHVIERGLKKFRFHVLGDSDWKSIVFHKFVEHHIKKVHNIDIEITYDSTSIQKTFMMSRFLFVPIHEDRSIWKMKLKSDLLHMNWKNKGTVEDYYYKLMGDISKEYNFKKLEPEIDPIYNDGKITSITYAYAILQVLQLFRICDEWSKELVDIAYPIYENGQTLEFSKLIEDCLKRFNNGKVSNAIHIRTSALSNSLDMLTNLDIDYADYLIERHMSIDEARSLKNSFITHF